MTSEFPFPKNEKLPKISEERTKEFMAVRYSIDISQSMKRNDPCCLTNGLLCSVEIKHNLD